jgi:hypothetical protein
MDDKMLHLSLGALGCTEDIHLAVSLCSIATPKFYNSIIVVLPKVILNLLMRHI